MMLQRHSIQTESHITNGLAKSVTTPAQKSPGERSSQYAAESSCRERYGSLTEWLSFIDTDEYMVREYVCFFIQLFDFWYLLDNFQLALIGSYETGRKW